MQSTKSLREKLTAWDAKNEPTAPLTEQQKDSFMDLTTQSCNRPLPNDLPVEDFPATRMPNVVDIKHKELGSLNIDKMETAQQFFSWFSEVEDQIKADEESPQRQFLYELHSQKSECSRLLDEVSHALSHLEELRDKYIHVSTKTNALHEACENLLDEQTKLVNMAESINGKLAYFNELERISSKLGSPTLTVTSDSFVPMLTRLDECIEYLGKHPQYKESGVYMSRFRQALSRALSLIKIHVTSILLNATQQVLPKKDMPNLTTDAFTLLYGKFRTNAPRVKSLMEQIEQRLDKSPEYSQLLLDCQQCVLQQRAILLGATVYRAVTDLAAKHERDHCALVRSGCAFMVHVCEDEYQLYAQFFSRPTPLLDEMLEGLCGSLYDVLRPLIIHVNHLETLAELCSILKIEMIEEHVRHNPGQLGAFEVICQQMLQDVQERLVYRTHIYIRHEIRHYVPAPGDLAYPDKLQMMQDIAESIKKGEIARQSSIHDSLEPLSTTPIPDAGTGGNMPMSPADLHGMWYPTVRRTLVCLSKLYRCIDRQTFQGLSQETLSLCIGSLVQASTSISLSRTPLDAHLFLIKHLLILREQIAPFHVDFAIKEMALDFTKIKDAAFGLLRERHRLFQMNSSNAILQFLLDGTPQVTETFVDSKKEVDTQLKKSCEEFIQHVSQQLIGSLKDFINKCDVVLKMREDPSAPQVDLRRQPFAAPEKVQPLVSAAYRNLKQQRVAVHTSMTLYLANKDTEYILFKPIKSNIQQCFQQLLQLLAEHYSEEDCQIIGCPSLEQINLLLASGGPAKQPVVPQSPLPTTSTPSAVPSQSSLQAEQHTPTPSSSSPSSSSQPTLAATLPAIKIPETEPSPSQPST